MKAIVWQERYKCSFKCPYCNIFALPQDKPLPDWKLFVDAFNKLRPTTLDITGGEPFLNKNIVDIINGVDCAIGITTNMSQDMIRFAREVHPSKVVNMTLSYHPTQNMSKDIFIGKALMLQSAGFSVNVNFVTYPEQVYLTGMLKREFEFLGIPFHVDPYASCENKHGNNETEQAFMRQYVGWDRMFRAGKTRADNVLCSAGHDYLMVNPYGDAHRCMTGSFINFDVVGNILDANFKLLDGMKPCAFGGQCGGCDRDKATIHDLA